MKISRSKLRIVFLLFISILLPISIALSSHAENYPDIENINNKFYYKEEHRFFHRPNNGYVLVSTNCIDKSMAALLDKDGNFDYSSAFKSTSIKFAYENTFLCENHLYLAGKSPEPEKGVIIGQLNLSNGKCIINKIARTDCDFSRGFTSDNNGNLQLVTVPAGQKIDSLTKPSVYIFDSKHNNTYLTAQPQDPEPGPPCESSEISAEEKPPDEPRDEPKNTETEKDIDSASSTPSEKLPCSSENYYFDNPVTIKSLQAELDANKKGQKILVFTKDKKIVQEGNIGTGMTIKTLKDKKVETTYTAVIAGDLDGLGTVTTNDYRILYDYLTQPSSGNKYILDGPFYEAAKISDNKGVDKTSRNLHTSDLLKLKKLIK